jgi:ketosteroid isomerase-like protein
MSQANADLVRDLYAAFGRGDVPALLTMLDDQIEWHTPPNRRHRGDFPG